MICPIGLEVQKIHACINDSYCTMTNMQSSMRVRSESTKAMIGDRNKRPPEKVVRYFPIIPFLKRLFANEKTTKLMRWHAEQRLNDGKVRHPTDAS